MNEILPKTMNDKNNIEIGTLSIDWKCELCGAEIKRENLMILDAGSAYCSWTCWGIDHDEYVRDDFGRMGTIDEMLAGIFSALRASLKK